MMRTLALLAALYAVGCDATADRFDWESDRLALLSDVEYSIKPPVHIVRDVYAVYTPEEWIGLRVMDVLENGEFRRWIDAVECEGYRFTGDRFDLYGPHDAYLFEKVK